MQASQPLQHVQDSVKSGTRHSRPQTQRGGGDWKKNNGMPTVADTHDNWNVTSRLNYNTTNLSSYLHTKQVKKREVGGMRTQNKKFKRGTTKCKKSGAAGWHSGIRIFTLCNFCIYIYIYIVSIYLSPLANVSLLTFTLKCC